MALGNPGDVVTFFLTNGTTTRAGVVIAKSGSTNDVAYDFAIPNGGQIAHCKEFTTTAVTVVTGSVAD